MCWWFCIFLLLSWHKNQTQSFSWLLWNDLLILKILPVTRFKDPKAAILILKMLTGSRLWFCKIQIGNRWYYISNSCAFSLQPMSGRQYERPYYQRIHRKYWLKCFRPSKKYPSRDTVSLRHDKCSLWNLCVVRKKSGEGITQNYGKSRAKNLRKSFYSLSQMPEIEFFNVLFSRGFWA